MTSCNEIVSVSYLKSFLQGTPITVSTTKDDEYCPTYTELINGSIVPVTNANSISDFHYGTDGIYINPSDYTGSTPVQLGCCEANPGDRNVRKQDLSAYFFDLSNFMVQLNHEEELCSASGELEGGYDITMHEKSMGSNCSVSTDSTTESYDICNSHVTVTPKCSEEYGRNTCDASQSSAGEDVECSTPDKTYTFSANLNYRGNTYSFSDSFVQPGMSINITWDKSVVEEEIESEGTEGFIPIGTISSRNVKDITAETEAEGCDAKVENGEIMLSVGDFDDDERTITVSVSYTTCDEFTATSGEFRQVGKPIPPSSAAPDCYIYEGSIGSCASQYYLCQYNDGCSSHISDWTYVDAMKLKIARDGYFSQRIQYDGHTHYPGGTDQSQERMNAHINRHSVVASDKENAVFHVFSARTSTNEGMFAGKTELLKITVPCEIEVIESNTFNGCTQLMDYGPRDNFTSIKDNAFYNCSSLPFIDGGTNLVTIGDNAFMNCTSAAAITLRNKVTTVGDNAFKNCTAANSATMANNVTSLGASAFENCYSMTSVTLSTRLTEIKDSTFKDCDNLTDIDTQRIVTIGDNAFYECLSLESIDLSSAKSIGDYAFQRCAELTSVTISEYTNTATIGQYAFDECESLKWADLSGANSIGNYAFSDCDAMTSLSLGTNTKYLGDYSFAGCTSLSDIDLEDVDKVGDHAFENCTSLTSVDLYPHTIGSYAFSDCTGIRSVYIEESVGSLPSSAFDGCTSLTYAWIDNPYYTDYFSGDNNIESVSFSSNVYGIDSYALKGCEYLEDVSMTNNVTSMGSAVFSGCTRLTSVSLSDRLTSIENDTFCDCTSLSSVDIPSGVEDIGNYAFQGCTSLGSITIPSNVSSIGSLAFDGCTRLTDIWADPTTPPSVGSGAFSGVTATVHVPSGSVAAYQSESGWNSLTIVGDN